MTGNSKRGFGYTWCCLFWYISVFTVRFIFRGLRFRWIGLWICLMVVLWSSNAVCWVWMVVWYSMTLLFSVLLPLHTMIYVKLCLDHRCVAVVFFPCHAVPAMVFLEALWRFAMSLCHGNSRGGCSCRLMVHALFSSSFNWQAWKHLLVFAGFKPLIQEPNQTT